MSADPWLAAFVALTFLLAGLSKGVIGMGLPTVAVGLLSLAYAPAQAAALLVVPSLVTNLWQMAAGPHLRALGRRLWPMMLAVAVSTWLGAGFLSKDASGYAATALGVALLLYAAVGLAAPQLRVRPNSEPWLGPLAGAATGAVTAVTGSFVLPSVPYLQALGLDRHALVQALGLSFTVSTAAMALGLAQSGVLQSFAGASALALAPAALGMWLGQRIRHRVSERTFRRCFFLGLLALGLHLAARAVW